MLISARLLLCLYLIVDSYVELYELVNSTLLYRLLVTPLLISDDELTELSTPVTEIVDAYALISRELVEKLQRVADNGWTEVADMEGLRNVG